MNTSPDKPASPPDLATAIVAASVPVGTRGADGATLLFSPILADAIARMQAELEKQKKGQANPPGPS